MSTPTWRTVLERLDSSSRQLVVEECWSVSGTGDISERSPWHLYSESASIILGAVLSRLTVIHLDGRRMLLGALLEGRTEIHQALNISARGM